MLSEQEKQFITYWEANRNREKRLIIQLFIGIPAGLLFAIPILLSVFSGRLWFKRADAVANSQMNPMVLVIAVIIITVFVAIFYKRHQWDMKDQHYQELKAKQQTEKNEKQQ